MGDPPVPPRKKTLRSATWVWSSKYASVWSNDLCWGNLYLAWIMIVFCSNMKELDLERYSREGYSSLIWVLTCRWDLKSRTHFYTKFCWKMKSIFIPEPHILSKKISHYFPKLLSFQANLRNFGIRLMKLGPFFPANFRKFWKYDHQFLHWIRGRRYTRSLSLRPISVARP